MAILLAAEVARRISGTELPAFIEQAVFRPLGMKHSALGLGRFPLEAMMRCQAENAAPESGAGDPTAKEWDWNSPYWRRLGRLGAAYTPQRPTWHGSSPSSFIRRARLFGRKPRG